MDIGALLLLLALLILIFLYLAAPMQQSGGQRRQATSAEEHELSSLLAERDRLLNALQELDFDHVLGKIPAEDYPAQRAELLKHGADVLRQIDAHRGLKDQPEAEDRVEAAIAARRADAAVQTVSGENPDLLNDDDLESLIASRRSDRKDKSGGFCPHCGKPVLRSDRFCPNCGKSIK